MPDPLRLAIAQLNPHVGAVAANCAGIRAARAEAARQGADLVLTSECSVAGFPPLDLARDAGFLDACAAAVADLAADTADGPGLLVGCPWRDGDGVLDAMLLLEAGRVAAWRARHEAPSDPMLPARDFDAGACPGPVPFRGRRLGLMVGSDGWGPSVAETLAESGADLLIVAQATPFRIGAPGRRLAAGVARVVETGLALVACAPVGSQDGLVFDGASFVLNPDRSLAALLPAFAPAVAVTHWDEEGELPVCCPGPLSPEPEGMEAVYRALMLGLADEVAKTGHAGVTIGLEAPNAALAVAVAVDALGPARVRGVGAAALAASFGIATEIPALAEIAAALRRVAPVSDAALAGCIRAALAASRGDLLLGSALRGERDGEGSGFGLLRDLSAATAAELARWRNAADPPGQGRAGALIPVDAVRAAAPAELAREAARRRLPGLTLAPVPAMPRSSAYSEPMP